MLKISSRSQIAAINGNVIDYETPCIFFNTYDEIKMFTGSSLRKLRIFPTICYICPYFHLFQFSSDRNCRPTFCLFAGVVIYEVCVEKWPSPLLQCIYTLSLSVIQFLVPVLVLSIIHTRISAYLSVHLISPPRQSACKRGWQPIPLNV